MSPPRSLGGYRIVDEIGRGGMGTVYRALAPDGREVALKRLNAEVTSHETVRRFLQEARLRIDHPNVVETLGAGLDSAGQPYIVFELLTGGSMRDVLREGPMGGARLIELVLQVCDGLSAAHRLGIVHRDIKPSNVFVREDGTVKILDFGIARLAAQTHWLTGTGDVVGTPSYVAPEQVQNAPVDERTDVWAVGVLLYRGLGGVAPFERPDVVSTLLAVVEDEPRPLWDLAPNAPKDLVDTIGVCMRKDPADRWPTIAALAAVLRQILPSSSERLAG